MKKIIVILALLISFVPINSQAATVIPSNFSHSYSLMVGEDIKLETSEVGNVKWTSKNKKIAVVSKKGIVKAVNAGNTVVIAKINKKTIEFDISVSKGNDAFITSTRNTKGDIVDKTIYITKGKYNSLSNGYSYGDAVKIIGASGNLTSSKEDEANKTLTEVYTWVGEDGVANASVIFINGKMTEKDEMFLK